MHFKNINPVLTCRQNPSSDYYYYYLFTQGLCVCAYKWVWLHYLLQPMEAWRPLSKLSKHFFILIQVTAKQNLNLHQRAS